MFFHHIFFGSHLEAEERILYAAHRHWFFFIKDTLRFLLLGVAIPGIAFFFFPMLWIPALFVTVFFLIGYGVAFCDWYFDAWLITNLSLIDVDWVSLFVRKSSRVDYESIEGVSYETTGFWGYLLQYGNLQIDKASGANCVILPQAANPKKVELEILRFRSAFIDNKVKDDESHLKDILTSMIRRHIKHGDQEQQ